jgi:signal peptide peptidase SppA
MATVRNPGLDIQPWAIHPATLQLLTSWVRGTVQPSAVAQSTGERQAGPTGSSIAVIPVTGVIEHHSDWMMEMFGGTSVDGLRDMLRGAMADPDVRAIVLDIDSPGGTVAGVPELADEIRAMRGGDKPIVAVANAFAASAAYWLGAQADELVVAPSAQVGSIGVYAMHQDISGMLAQDGIDVTLVSAGPHKVEGNMFEPLTDEARADLQSRVDESYGMFVEAVAAGRRVPTAQVKADFGGGRMVTAKAAVKAGMADRVGTLDDTLVRLSKAGRRRLTQVALADNADLDAALVDTTITSSTALNETTTANLVPTTFQGTYVSTTTTPYVTGDFPITITPQVTLAEPPTLGDQLAAYADAIAGLVERVTTRAGLRQSEGRPAYSTNTERSLRTIRDAIDALLVTDDPDTSPPPVPDDPVPPADPAPPVTAVPPPVRFRSREDWLRYLEVHH